MIDRELLEEEIRELSRQCKCFSREGSCRACMKAEKLNDKLDMTQKLGDAFLGQQKDVMAAIQTLRAKADKAGNLKSGKEQKVTTTQQDGQTVIIILAIASIIAWALMMGKYSELKKLRELNFAFERRLGEQRGCGNERVLREVQLFE